MEKEIKELEGRLSQEVIVLRSKKYNLEVEIQQVTNHKIKLVGDIISLQKEITYLQDEKDKLAQENEVVQTSIKKELLGIAKEKARLDQAQKANEERKDFLINAAGEVKDEEEKVRKDAVKLKAEKVRLDEQEKTFKEWQVKLVKDEQKIVSDRKEFEASISQKLNEIERQKEEITHNLEVSQKIKKEYEIKMLEVLERENRLTAQDLAMEIEKRTLAGQMDVCLKETKELEKEIDTYKARCVALDRIKESLKTKEDEIEIRRLRVEKLIKEKNIASELAALEKELKK